MPELLFEVGPTETVLRGETLSSEAREGFKLVVDRCRGDKDLSWTDAKGSPQLDEAITNLLQDVLPATCGRGVTAGVEPCQAELTVYGANIDFPQNSTVTITCPGKVFPYSQAAEIFEATVPAACLECHQRIAEHLLSWLADRPEAAQTAADNVRSKQVAFTQALRAQEEVYRPDPIPEL